MSVNQVNLPKGDESIERHQFYASLKAAVENNAHDLNGIGKKVTALSEAHEAVEDKVKKAEQTIRTAWVGLSIMWSIAGSGAVWYVKETVGSYKEYVVRIDKLEKTQATTEATLEKLKDTPDKVENLKRITAEHQKSIEDLQLIKTK